MTEQEISKAILHIYDEKKKLEAEITKIVQAFEKKYGVNIAFIRNIPYIKENGKEETSGFQIDLRI